MLISNGDIESYMLLYAEICMINRMTVGRLCSHAGGADCPLSSCVCVYVCVEENEYCNSYDLDTRWYC